MKVVSFGGVRAVLSSAVVVAALAAVPASATATPTVALKSLHSGEFCAKAKQGYYLRHGYRCRRASDGRNRLFGS